MEPSEADRLPKLFSSVELNRESAESPPSSPNSPRIAKTQIPPQIPRQLRSILIDVLASRQRYNEICSDTLETANSLANLVLRRNNARGQTWRWAPGETDDEMGWDAVVDELNLEIDDTRAYLNENAIEKLRVQLSRVNLAYERLRHLVDETRRNYGQQMVSEVAALDLLTLDSLHRWCHSVHGCFAKDFELRVAMAEKFLPGVKSRQDAVLYLASWKYGPYLEDDESVDDDTAYASLIERAIEG